MTTPQEKEMPVAKKLKILQEKCLHEPAGVCTITKLSVLYIFFVFHNTDRHSNIYCTHVHVLLHCI